MREILFRGKRVDNGEWVEGNYIRRNDPLFAEPVFWCSLIQDMALSAYEVIPETVGQFTGLTDANGINIFDGDNMQDNFGAISQVVYVPKYGGYRQLSKIGYSPLNQAEILGSKDCVIGNIHDNPELL